MRPPYTRVSRQRAGILWFGAMRYMKTAANGHTYLNVGGGRYASRSLPRSLALSPSLSFSSLSLLSPLARSLSLSLSLSFSLFF